MGVLLKGNETPVGPPKRELIGLLQGKQGKYAHLLAALEMLIGKVLSQHFLALVEALVHAVS